MKTFTKLLSLLLLCMLMLGAVCTASDTPEVLTYTYTEDAPEVDAQKLFLSVY